MYVLNEVLSLNAQECFSVNHFGDINIFLNEVLSLNAQELKYGMISAIVIPNPQ